MLIVKLDDLQNIPDGSRIIDIDTKIENLETLNNVTGKVKVSLTAYGADVTGHVQADIKLECDRCLEEFTYHASVDIEEKFVNDSIVMLSAREVELKSENFVEELNEDKEINISDLIYQAIILDMPTQKLCNDACEGSDAYKKILSEANIDPRLEIFKQLSEEE